MSALARLSGDAQVFLEKIWASHMHVHHADPGDLAGLLSLDDVDHLLTATGLRAPALRVAKDGSVLPTSAFTRGATLAGAPVTGLVDARKVLDLFDGGATVVLQGLHRYWVPLAALVRDLESELGHPCQANAYLTPPGSQGFALHSDSHDVFVFQTHGTKMWEVHGDAGRQEVVLEPGVSMYLPTGTPHAARSQDAASLHVTIGLNQISWRQLLTQVTADVLADPQYDGRLPAGYLDDPAALAAGLADHLRTLSVHLASQEPERLARSQAERFETSRNPHLVGGLGDRVRLAGLDDDTVLVRRRGSVCTVTDDTDRLRVLLGDREMRMPLRLREPMLFVSRARELRANDLATWLDAESRLVLVRRLVREGLLQVPG